MSELSEWKRRNPLVEYRYTHDLQCRAIAKQLEIDLVRILDYEAGLMVPNKTKMAKLAARMDLDPEVLRKEWVKWYRESPRRKNGVTV